MSSQIRNCRPEECQYCTQQDSDGSCFYTSSLIGQAGKGPLAISIGIPCFYNLPPQESSALKNPLEIKAN
ncbi:Uncharacterised protein [uncultured archaeon]|nr:Uncharacterised protein [uncultured archaeon]